MRIISNTFTKLIFILLAIFLLPKDILATGDVLLNLRFYEGIRKVETEKPTVVTATYIEPFFVSSGDSETSLGEEKSKLKRIYNLEDIKLLTRAKWGWQDKEKHRSFKVNVLNGAEFVLALFLEKKQDVFRLEMKKRKKEKKEMTINTNFITQIDTNFLLTAEHTAIFGFEDKNGSIYFISFHRETDAEVIDWPVGEVSGRTPGKKEDDPIRISAQYKPRLVHSVRPDYPPEALKKGVKGDVILEAVIDKEGKVKNVKAISGKPELNEAAVAAIGQWRYKRHATGESRPIKMSAIVSFGLQDDNKTTVEKKQEVNKPSAVPNIWPTRGYLTDCFGWRKHPVTGKKDFHVGQDISTQLGSKVVATADGEVIYTGFKKIAGNLIIIDHHNGYTTRYGRLKGFAVEKGDRVKRGQVIGYVGNTGSSTAPHLHYEVRLEDKPLNPLHFIKD